MSTSSPLTLGLATAGLAVAILFGLVGAGWALHGPAIFTSLLMSGLAGCF